MNFYPHTDLWKYLCSTEKTVVMYGMGNGADKILSVCAGYGIEVADFFASDGFVRGHSFHGKTVLSYSAVKEKYGAENIIVLLSFASSLPDVMELFYKVADECELYAPDVPVCGEELFDLEFFNAHRVEIDKVYNLLCDEESKSIYENVIKYKLSGDIKYLRYAVSDRDTVWETLIGDVQTAADLGAYNGDTVRELKSYRPDVKTVYAFEPDRRNFRKLSEYANATDSPKVIPVNAAAWSEDTTLSFADSGNRNSGAFAKGKQIEVNALSLDSVLGNSRVDYVKYDVEGAEKEAIIGSEKVILNHRPTLLVSAYHRSEDIFALALQINALCPDYRLYYRRYPYVPAWDLNLMCVIDK